MLPTMMKRALGAMSKVPGQLGRLLRRKEPTRAQPLRPAKATKAASQRRSRSPRVLKGGLSMGPTPLRVLAFKDVDAAAAKSLGKGGYGAVFACSSVAELTDVACKLALSSGAAPSLVREAAVGLHLATHSNGEDCPAPQLLAVVEGTPSYGCPCTVNVRDPATGSVSARRVNVCGVVLECMHGGDLHQAMFRLSRAERVLVLCEAGKALRRMHQANVLHCDVKTSNFLLDEVVEDGIKRLKVKVCDFGMARYLHTPDDYVLCKYRFGTPGLMAPEVEAVGDGSDPSKHAWIGTPADVFSFGKMIQYMLGSTAALHGVDDLMAWCCEERPARRPTMGQVVQYLEEVHEQILCEEERPRSSKASRAGSAEEVEVESFGDGGEISSGQEEEEEEEGLTAQLEREEQRNGELRAQLALMQQLQGVEPSMAGVQSWLDEQGEQEGGKIGGGLEVVEEEGLTVQLEREMQRNELLREQLLQMQQLQGLEAATSVAKVQAWEERAEVQGGWECDVIGGGLEKKQEEKKEEEGLTVQLEREMQRNELLREQLLMQLQAIPGCA